MNFSSKKSLEGDKGFTLLEILLVVAALAILAGIVIFAINPGRQLGATRDAQRESNVQQILSAVQQWSIDNDGAVPAGITDTATEICSPDATDCTGYVDLSDLVDDNYMVSMPEDPQNTSDTGVGYEISQNTNGRITVTAPGAEETDEISVSN